MPSENTDFTLNKNNYATFDALTLKQLIKQRLNDSLTQIGIEPVFDDIDQELLEKTSWFDEDVLGNTATDFFFKRPTEYSKKDKSYDEDDLF